MKKSIAQEFIAQAIFRMEENSPRIKKCLDRLSEDQVWQKPNGSSNSIGNLILHLCGNITQYILSSLGNIKDQRARDLEFSTSGGFSKEELFNKIDQVISAAVEVINNCEEEQLLKVKDVQGFELSGIGIIIHVVEHLSYHTGQIAFWTKYLKDQDLGFYADLDLDVKNR
jgi:uncharacterized damage-inducible protein DinB